MNMLNSKIETLPCRIFIALAFIHSASASALTNNERINAAITTVALNPACTSLKTFWWEVGDQNGKIFGSTGGDNSDPSIGESRSMSIASASKWIFGAYVLEKLAISSINPLTQPQIEMLNFTSGYDNFNDNLCGLTRSVFGCGNIWTNGFRSDGTNGTQNHIGAFSYSSGHLQKLAQTMSLGWYYDNWLMGAPLLSTEIMSQVGQAVSLTYFIPDLAGGVVTQPQYYRVLLQNILSGSLRMSQKLSTNQVCGWTGEATCNAISSATSDYIPATYQREHWHYSLAHWVEDSHGDNAFSSPGLYGFYPWIDQDRRYYGMVAHQDAGNSVVNGVQVPSYVASAFCGRKIRRAFTTGIAQTVDVQ